MYAIFPLRSDGDINKLAVVVFCNCIKILLSKMSSVPKAKRFRLTVLQFGNPKSSSKGIDDCKDSLTVFIVGSLTE